MKMVIAYIRTECASHVMRDLYEAGVGGITCYMVHGMRSVKSRRSFIRRGRSKFIVCPHH